MTDNGLKTVKIGVIGLGGSGRRLLSALLDMEDVEITAICDLYEERLQLALELFDRAGHPKADVYAEYKDLLARDDVEGVIIATTWITHAEVAVAAMKAGKYAGIEVGGTAALEECWELVRTSEQTGMPCMLFEKSCYGRDELAILKMVKQGLLGKLELLHCGCGYDEPGKRDEVLPGEKSKRNSNRNGKLYPIHGLGPFSKMLTINRGNRLVSLTSTASKARETAAKHRAAEQLGEDDPFAETEFAQKAIVTTLIKCAGGEMIQLIHGTNRHWPYSRAGRVQGTEGIWMEDNSTIHIEGRSPSCTLESFAPYREQYEHPIWQEYLRMGVRGGHNGMDYLVLRAFLESVMNRTQTPIDVYDTAVWMAITVLSEESFALGSAPVSIPDFTQGKWIKREAVPASRYSLGTIS